jgi:hypothetical protein
MIGCQKSIYIARFVVNVVDALDLGAIYESYEEKDRRGHAAYDISNGKVKVVIPYSRQTPSPSGTAGTMGAVGDDSRAHYVR